MAVRFLRARRGATLQRHRYRHHAKGPSSLWLLRRARRRDRGEHDPSRCRSRRLAEGRSRADRRDSPRRGTVAGLDMRLAEAEAALATLDEAVGKNVRSLLERDGAILRLVYTFEAVW